MIRSVELGDTQTITNIYNHYIKNTIITFEEVPLTTDEMQNRIETVTKTFPWLVYEENGEIFGYAYAAKWHLRGAYRFTVESTVYLAPDATGKGIGTKLYRALLDDLKTRKVHSVIGGIALPNPASMALHEKMGFTKAAHYKEVGWKFNQWIDVGYWQLILDSNNS